MRANSAWGLLGLAFVFWSLRFSMQWTTGHEEYGSYLIGLGIVCATLSAICFAWPLFSGKRGSVRPGVSNGKSSSAVSISQSGGIVIQGERNTFTINAAQAITPATANDTASDSGEKQATLELVFGFSGQYVEANSYNSVNVMKTICVGVKNSGRTHLSNCKLKFEAPRPHDAIKETWLRDGPFSLNPGEERYLGVAYYNEPNSAETIPEPWIRLSSPPSGNFWQPPQIPVSGGVVTLIATCSEATEVRSLLRLWAKEGRLFWEDATSVVGSVPSAPVHDVDAGLESVSMPDAAATAYGELRSTNASWAKAADTFAQLGVAAQIYFAGAIAGQVAIYGKHPPSRRLELIDSSILKSGHFKNEGASFYYHGDPKPHYVDIAVRREDLSQAIAQMRDSAKDPW
jgi:hypothetical protein